MFLHGNKVCQGNIKKDQKGVFQEITIRQWIAKIFFQI